MSAILAPAKGVHAVHRVNPVAKLGAAAVLSLCLVVTLDWVSAAVALLFECVLFFFAGLSARQFWLRTLPIWIAAPLTGLTILLYGQASGQVHFEFLLARVTDGSIELAVATVLRVLAIALPAVVLFVTVDPTDLADGLTQVLRLPSRFVLGALAGLRLVGLLIEDWRSLELARRARGVADRGRLGRLAGQAFALLVLSIRRGSKLATAMEARAFGASGSRSPARESRMRAGDWMLVLLGAAIGATSIAAALLAGTWNPLGS